MSRLPFNPAKGAECTAAVTRARYQRLVVRDQLAAFFTLLSTL